MSEVTPPVDTSIAVAASPVREQIGQAVRTAMVSIGGMLAGKAGIDADTGAAIASLVVIGGTFLWGQRRVLKTHAQRVTLASIVPDHIAKVIRR